jgi:hypothetical protein
MGNPILPLQTFTHAMALHVHHGFIQLSPTFRNQHSCTVWIHTTQCGIFLTRRNIIHPGSSVMPQILSSLFLAQLAIHLQYSTNFNLSIDICAAYSAGRSNSSMHVLNYEPMSLIMNQDPRGQLRLKAYSASTFKLCSEDDRSNTRICARLGRDLDC